MEKSLWADHIPTNISKSNYDVREVSFETNSSGQISIYGNDSNTITSGNISNFPSLPTDWGPRRDPLEIVIPITVIYVLTFISGVIGNISTCIVISRNKSMHTATNYYLFSLAISDLLLLISGLPPEIYYVWSKYPYVFGEVFCVLQGFAAETSANATVLTITAFTIERYVAICHPFLSHTLSKLSRAIKFIVAIWMIALCLAIPPAMGFGVVCEKINNTIIDDLCVCMVKRQVIPHTFEISTCVFFVTPMSLITVLYVLIGLQLHRSTVGPSRGNSVKLKHRVYKTSTSQSNNVNNVNSAAQAVLMLNENGNEKNVQNQDEDGRKNFAKNAQATKHVVKMLVAVVVAFFICWAPFHAQRLFAIYGERSSSNTVKAFQTLTYISGVLYYLSTTVNPLLYNIMSHKFREAFKSTFKQCFRRRILIKGDASRRGRCYATLSCRSSQVNSHSNTDSYSKQSSLRYLDVEMARLQESQRPLVVSFRRKETYNKNTKNRKYRDIMKHEHQMNHTSDVPDEGRYEGYVENCIHDTTISILEEKISEENHQQDLTYVEVHSLQTTHICPLRLQSIEEIEFDHKKRSLLSKSLNNYNMMREQHVNGGITSLSKSCTMPNMITGSKRGKCSEEENQNECDDGIENFQNENVYNNNCITSPGIILDCPRKSKVAD